MGMAHDISSVFAYNLCKFCSLEFWDIRCNNDRLGMYMYM